MAPPFFCISALYNWVDTVKELPPVKSGAFNVNDAVVAIAVYYDAID